jgi:hypothetical protein
MGILTVVSRLCKQKAVYWPPAANDGYGKYTFEEPEEILVRWDDILSSMAKDSSSRTKISKDGKEYISIATIVTVNIPTGGWHLDGYLFLGELADLESSLSPYDVEGAYEIKNIESVPDLHNTGKMFVIDL